MNHAITVGGLLIGLGVLGGFLAAMSGLLMLFAGMMSDAGDDGTGNTGCVVLVVGLVIFAGCIVMALR